MKFKIVIVLFFLSSNFYAQDYVITYGKEIKSVFAERVVASSAEMKNISEAVIESAKAIEYKLRISNNISSFTSTAMLNDKASLRMASILGGTTGSFYIDKNKQYAVNIKEVSGEKFQVKLDIKEWKIHKETKQIGKYTCYKATGIELIRKPSKVNKMPVTVWFCPKLPSYFGPAGYFGLPGTILRVEKQKVVLYATHIEAIKAEKTIKIPNKGIKVTEEELHNIAINGMPDFGVGN